VAYKKEPEKSKAKVEFAEDVAAFANSKGGALIIGASNTPVEIDGIGNKLEAEGRLKNTPQVLDERVQYSNDVFYFKPVIIKDKNGDDKLCLVIVIVQNKEVVAVKCEYNRYSYPVRKETGLDRISCKEVAKQKKNVKNDNFDFMQELVHYTYDK
jgi:predicted HTH transcriptional regulator